MRPDLCRKRPLAGCTLNASITGTSAATIQYASPQNPLVSPVNKSCSGAQWLTRQFQQSRHVNIRVVRLSKAIERVSCAHCQRDPQSYTMCLKCAPSFRGWRPAPPRLKWWFLLASCRGLQSPMLDSALASRYTSCRATCPRSWTSEPSNLETSTGAHACASVAELSTPARHMDARFDASYSGCRTTPTSNGIRCSL